LLADDAANVLKGSADVLSAAGCGLIVNRRLPVAVDPSRTQKGWILWARLAFQYSSRNDYLVWPNVTFSADRERPTYEDRTRFVGVDIAV
jgi:hypothetical protein